MKRIVSLIIVLSVLMNFILSSFSFAEDNPQLPIIKCILSLYSAKVNETDIDKNDRKSQKVKYGADEKAD